MRSVDELGPEDVGHGGFQPTFTHQLFDDEKIEGYSDGDVKIRLLYVATSLHFLVKISTSDKDAAKWVFFSVFQCFSVPSTKRGASSN